MPIIDTPTAAATRDAAIQAPRAARAAAERAAWDAFRAAPGVAGRPQ